MTAPAGEQIEGISLRQAGDADLPRVREFFPEAFQLGKPQICLIAEQQGNLLGGWCLSEPAVGENESHYFWRVIEPAKGQPFAVRMMEALIATSTKLALKKIIRAQMISSDAFEVILLKRFGFQAEDEIVIYQSSVHGVLARLHESGLAELKIPPSVNLQIREPDAADRPHLRDLLIKHALMPLFKVESLLVGFVPEISKVVTMKGVLVGVMLVRAPFPRMGYVEARIVEGVSQRLRGWINWRLMKDCLQAGADRGFENVCFSARPREHRETQNFALGKGAAEIGREFLFSKML